MPAAIDTLKFSKRLTEAGMAPAQAEAIAEAVSEGMAEGLATKQDLTMLGQGIHHEMAELRTELGQLRSEMATKQELSALQVEMAKMEARIIRWNIGAIIAMTAVFAAVVKLL